MNNIDIKAICSDTITLTLINESNLSDVRKMFQDFPDSEYMLGELERSYAPKFDESGRRIKYGFYTSYNNKLAGMSLLGISSWKHSRGYTGADTLKSMRGQSIAPDSKPLLFYLAFEILNLNRIETGCFVSNIASKKSIEKTPGFKLEGILREFGRNDKGEFEDEYRYAILKKDWIDLYDNSSIRLIR
ncbi:MAG: GNAT family N-acetyltransferase [candidate division Zixibacteria bacterium]|nr:GNAT family N-acetyltransferase [candidate division Zixibacteria bacterium]